MKNKKEKQILTGVQALFLAGEVEAIMAARRMDAMARWDHKAQGTWQTHEHAANARQGAIARLYQDGHIDVDQMQWAMEIAHAAESIQRDVDVRGASYEMRVDYSGSGRDALIEGIIRVQMHVAYTWWRSRIPEPRRAVLAMLIGEPISYSTAALRYRMGRKRARRLLIHSIDLWAEAMDHADTIVDKQSLADMHKRLR